MPRPSRFPSALALLLLAAPLPRAAAQTLPGAAADRAARIVQAVQAFEQAGEFDKALEEVAQMIKNSPDDADGYFWAARLQREKGDFEKAIFNYRRGLMIDPTRRAQALWNVAYSDVKWSEALEARGDLNAAIERVQEAVAVLDGMQSDAEALGALRDVDFKKTLAADRERLQTLQQNQKQGDLSSARDAISRAGIFFDRGMVEIARRELQNALDLDPNNAEAWKDYGKCLSALKQFDQSADACRKAIAIDPKYKEAYNNLAVNLDELKKYSEAIDTYNKALSIDPTYVRALTNMGETYQKTGDYPKATDCYARALKADPGNAVAHFDMAGVEVLMKHYDSATDHLRQLLKSDPGNLNACMMIGDVSMIAGKPDDAVSAYQKALIVAPGDAGARDALAKAVQKRDATMLGKYFKSSDMVEPSAGAALPKTAIPAIPAAPVVPILPPPVPAAAPASPPDSAPVSAPPRFSRFRQDDRTSSFPSVFPRDQSN